MERLVLGGNIGAGNVSASPGKREIEARPMDVASFPDALRAQPGAGYATTG
jgi:hypothetical protein